MMFRKTERHLRLLALTKPYLPLFFLALLLYAVTVRAQIPLLTTQWTQDYPCNMLCPADPYEDYAHSFAGCPAIAMKDGKAHIDATLCVGCEVCEQLCAFDAIGKGESK